LKKQTAYAEKGQEKLLGRVGRALLGRKKLRVGVSKKGEKKKDHKCD